MVGRGGLAAAAALAVAGAMIGHAALVIGYPGAMIGGSAQQEFTLEQVFWAPYPDHLVSARNADRIAWTQYDEGPRNVWTAAAPDYQPEQLTRYTRDDGWEMPEIQISDDGSVVAWSRGDNMVVLDLSTGKETTLVSNTRALGLALSPR